MEKNQFCIREGYIENLNPQYFLDNPSQFIYQPDAYQLAYYLAEREDIRYIIDIGGGNGDKLSIFDNNYNLITVDYGENIDLLKKKHPRAQVINFNLEEGLPDFGYDIISNCIVIFSDVIEHIINPHTVLKDLSRLSKECKYMIVTTPDRTRARGVGDFGPPLNPCHVREWSIDEFHDLLKKYDFLFSLIGYTINTDYHMWKNNIIALCGKHATYKPVDPLKVLAVINTYNEEDIITETINHLLKQGIDVKVFDNWSTDKTYDIVREISLKNSRVTVERFPDKPTQYYEWERLLSNVEKVSKNCNYDWVLHYDADEIRLSPWKETTLAEAISFVDYLGFNAIDFTVLDFRPIDKRYENINSIEEWLRFFEFGKRPGHFTQIKGWKVIKNVTVDLASSGGHEVQFAGRKIYPIKFINKHYPLRTEEQTKKKIFKDRRERFSPSERARGWHAQYDDYNLDQNFIWKKDELINWNLNSFYADFFVERISGIGIKR